MIIVSEAVNAGVRQSDPVAKFLYLIVAYVALLTASSIADANIIKLLANAMAPGIVALLMLEFLLLPPGGFPLAGVVWGLALYYLGMAGSGLVGLSGADAVDFLKISLFPLFVLFGMKFEVHRKSWIWERKVVKSFFLLLIMLPLLALAAQFFLRGVSLEHSAQIGIFVNRNNAALYAVTLLSLYMVLSQRPLANPLLFIGVGLIFGTLGVLFAAIAGLLISVGNWRTARAVLLGVLVLVGVIWLFPDFPIAGRLQPVFDSIALIASGRIDLQAVTYGDLVRILETTDLSFIFRLKHWWNLLHLYADGEVYQWLFGLGVGSSVRLSDIGLVPHNDYLRYLVEFGLVSMTGFVVLLFSLVRLIGRRWELVPTVIVACYFFSENLINNYLAMMVMFFCAGALATRFYNEEIENKYHIKQSYSS